MPKYNRVKSCARVGKKEKRGTMRAKKKKKKFALLAIIELSLAGVCFDIHAHLTLLFNHQVIQYLIIYETKKKKNQNST